MRAALIFLLRSTLKNLIATTGIIRNRNFEFIYRGWPAIAPFVRTTGNVNSLPVDFIAISKAAGKKPAALLMIVVSKSVLLKVYLDRLSACQGLRGAMLDASGPNGSALHSARRQALCGIRG